MKKDRLQGLLRQYFNNTISSADCIELLDYLNSTDTDELINSIDEELLNLSEGPNFGGNQSQEVLRRIKSDPRFIQELSKPASQPTKYIRLYQQSWFRIAAALLIFITAGLLVLRYKNTIATNSQKTGNGQKLSMIIPGGKKAVLTMANGKTIVLTGAPDGVLAKVGAVDVLKTRNGEIVYDTKNEAATKSNPVEYNTLITPKGGEYQVVLPDGTKVWLNAASSITYPVEFTGNDRQVKLNGEAYFEVAKNKAKPFYVNINNVKVRILGTHFNISAYSDDNIITTTLLEGSVNITKNNSSSLLKPGQQAVIGSGSDKINVSEANIEDAIAWKNGYFIFSDENVTQIMKKVSRWYDVDVEYHGNLNDQRFGGTYYQSKSITELLQHLAAISKVHFTIQGRRVIVME